MSIALTTAGSSACDDLGLMQMMLILVSSDNAAHNHRLAKVRKPDALANQEYTNYLESSLGEWGVCRVVDIYQWYNRQVLKVSAQHSPEVLNGFRDGVRLDGKDVSALATGVNPVEVIIDKVLFQDKSVRTHLHKVLGIWEEEEMNLLVEARNCFVHALGDDKEGRVGKLLSSKQSPWKIPLFVNSGKVRATLETALSAIRIGLAQISIMDQQFGNKYSLPRTAYQPRKITREQGFMKVDELSIFTEPP